MKAASISVGLLLSLLASSANADLIAYWNFNSYNGDDFVIPANSGTGSITITGFATTDLNNFGGTTLNALFGDAAGTSLSLVNSANNGDFLTVSFAMSGFQDLVLTYATQRSATGFNSNQWSYSTNGTTFTNFGAAVVPDTSFAVVTRDFSSIAALDNSPTAFLRYTVSGATSSSGNNRIDNLQLNASATPEPSTLLLVAIALPFLGAVCYRSRRSIAECPSPGLASHPKADPT